jgi:hypothetical protein
MNSGVFDNVLFFLNPDSPLRSDRVMGMVLLLASAGASAYGLDWGPGEEANLVELWNGMLTGVTGVVTPVAGLVAWLGVLRAKNSSREF